MGWDKEILPRPHSNIFPYRIGSCALTIREFPAEKEVELFLNPQRWINPEWTITKYEDSYMDPRFFFGRKLVYLFFYYYY